MHFFLTVISVIMYTDCIHSNVYNTRNAMLYFNSTIVLPFLLLPCKAWQSLQSLAKQSLQVKLKKKNHERSI